MGDYAIDLYWLPIGAGGHSVRLNGRIYEVIAARLGHRPACDLYHSALVVQRATETFAIETAPIRTSDGPARGVVAEGAVGSALLGRLKLFRYELRCWRNGVIPDVGEAVDSPCRLSDCREHVRALLAAMPFAPTPVWGRDELQAGEMWNSNSFISWLLTRAGIDAGTIRLPAGGRAPGWLAGIVVARREEELVRGEQRALELEQRLLAVEPAAVAGEAAAGADHAVAR